MSKGRFVCFQHSHIFLLMYFTWNDIVGGGSTTMMTIAEKRKCKRKNFIKDIKKVYFFRERWVHEGDCCCLFLWLGAYFWIFLCSLYLKNVDEKHLEASRMLLFRLRAFHQTVVQKARSEKKWLRMIWDKC